MGRKRTTREEQLKSTQGEKLRRTFMKAYGNTKKIMHNYPEAPYKKGHISWWEVDCKHINNKIARRKSKELFLATYH